MKIEIEGILTILLSIVVLGSGGCYFPGTQPLPMPVPPPAATEIARMELGLAISNRIDAGIQIVMNRDFYRIISQERFEALVNQYRFDIAPAPHPEEVSVWYEEDVRRHILRYEAGAAVGIARLYPPALALQYGYQPEIEYSWLIYVTGSSGNLQLFLVDVRRDLGFLWDSLVGGSWVDI